MHFWLSTICVESSVYLGAMPLETSEVRLSSVTEGHLSDSGLATNHSEGEVFYRLYAVPQYKEGVFADFPYRPLSCVPSRFRESRRLKYSLICVASSRDSIYRQWSR